MKPKILLATALIFILTFASAVQAQEANTSPVTTITIGTDSSWKSMDAAVKGWTSAGSDDSWWPDSWESAYPLPGLSQARAIWYPETPVPLTAYFRKSFDINGVEVISGRMHVVICAADVKYGMPDVGKVFIYINDQYVDKMSSGGYMNNWWREKDLDISSYLTPGKNVIAVKIEFTEWATEPPTDSKYNWWGLDATIRYLLYHNEPLLANAGVDQTVTTGAGVTLDGSASRGPDGSIISYEWDFGDGTSSAGRIVTHAYSKEGVYTVVLTVADNSGTEATDTVTIKVIRENNPPIISSLFADQREISAEGSVRITATAEDADGDAILYNWHCDDGILEGAGPTVIWNAPDGEGTYTISIEIDDGHGGVETGAISIKVISKTTPTPGPWWTDWRWLVMAILGSITALATIVLVFRRR